MTDIDLDELANDVRYAGGNGTSDYWRGFNDGIDKLVATLEPGLIRAANPEAAPEDTAWLIERGQPEGLDWPEWWTVTNRWGLTVAHGWTRDAFEAVRYPSKERAEAVIARFDLPNHPFRARAVEHGFTASPAPTTEEPER